MSAVDTSRAPHGERAACALVDAVVAGDDRLEHHYLEVKSELDLGTKRDQAKLAKFILGAANRMPDKASAAFGGYAVMVIGASQRELAGVPPTEVLVIEKAVRPFLGADGPKWDIAHVPIPDSKREVLLLFVDPPQWGDTPFVCLKDGDGKLRDGAVFVRASGETREAKSDELTQLLRRASAGVSPVVELEVRLIGAVAQVDRSVLDTLLEEFIEEQVAKLHLALTLSKQPSRAASGDLTGYSATAAFAAQSTSALHVAMTNPADRTESEYHVAIELWAQRTREGWPEAVRRFLGGVLPGVQVEVINGERTFFEDAEVKIHVAGDVIGIELVELGEAAVAVDLGLPVPPRSWGSTQTHLGQNIGNWAPSYDLGSIGAAPRRSSWSTSGSVNLDFEIGELRPLRSEISDDLDVVLIAANSDPDQFVGTWQLTARGHHAVYSGELNVGVEDSLDLESALREILELPNANTGLGSHGNR